MEFCLPKNGINFRVQIKSHKEYGSVGFRCMCALNSLVKYKRVRVSEFDSNCNSVDAIL